MLRTILFDNQELPVDYSIMTALKLAEAYNTDITGLSEVFSHLNTLEEQLQFVTTVGAIALTEGSLRQACEQGHGPAKRYTKYDVLDVLTADMSLAEVIIQQLSESLEATKVFQTAPPKVVPKTKAMKRHRE